jgi:hypothetical protein
MAFEKIRGIFKPPESQARGMTQEERREAFKKKRRQLKKQ